MSHPHHHHHHQDPSFLLDALYCEEEHWEQETYCYRSDNTNPTPDLLWEDEELTSLFSKEQQHPPLCSSLEINPSLAYRRRRRRKAVEWILNVVAHHSFSTLTAVLAVNYLDRFLFSFQFHSEKPWMSHLAAVSCLSLAAKVEETHVPLLLDLQVEESKYVFEAKTIQRMEILVLSSLEWKMNPVTPLSFIDYITRRLGLNNNIFFWEFLNRCDSLLLSLIADCRFMCYLPSVIATVTMLYVSRSIEPCMGVEFQTQLLPILGVDKGKVEECFKLVQELTSRGFGNQFNKRKFGSLPGSPRGVMDLSCSSDSSNDLWAVAASVSSSPEPLSKKSRAQEKQSDAGDVLG